MAYEIVPGMSGFGAYGSGYGSFGGAGDLLGESCLCGPAGSCSNAKIQGPAMAQLRAAMAAAGLSPSSGVWKQAEANQMNALATAGGQPTSSKFLTDGGPCRALKAKLAAPAPQPGGGTTTTGGVTCASLLSQAPPIPPGTPIDAVIAVLQQLSPPGFDVRACVANSAPPSPMPNTTIPLPGQDTLPPGTAGGSVTTGGDTSGISPLVILGLGLVAVMGVGGIAFVALSPKMRKNGKRVIPFQLRQAAPRDDWEQQMAFADSAAIRNVPKYLVFVRRAEGSNSALRRDRAYESLNGKMVRDARAEAKRVGVPGGRMSDFVHAYLETAGRRLQD